MSNRAHHLELWRTDHRCVWLPADPIQNNDESHDHRTIYIRLDLKTENIFSKSQWQRCCSSLLPRYPCDLLTDAVADLATSSPETALDWEANMASTIWRSIGTSWHVHFCFMIALHNWAFSHWEELLWSCPLALAFFWRSVTIPLVMHADNLLQQKKGKEKS